MHGMSQIRKYFLQTQERRVISQRTKGGGEGRALQNGRKEKGGESVVWWEVRLFRRPSSLLSALLGCEMKLRYEN
jgi:hypothetical protein